MANPLTKLKPKWRWLQFSIRTMLVIVTVSCVALSVWVAPAERQRRAVKAIEALEGTVYYAHDEAASDSFPLTFLRRWLPQVYFDQIKEISLSATQVTDADLAHLDGLTSLEILWLGTTQVTDAGLPQLQGLTSLRELSLWDTQVTDAGLPHLHGLTSLRQLWLRETQVTDAGIGQLRTALPNCSIHGP
jgi:Leucine-rich repeat (LRR) protein